MKKYLWRTEKCSVGGRGGGGFTDSGDKDRMLWTIQGDGGIRTRNNI